MLIWQQELLLFSLLEIEKKTLIPFEKRTYIRKEPILYVSPVQFRRKQAL